MQEIGGIINDLIVLGVFIYSTLLVSGKLKLNPENQEKLDAFLSKKGKWFRPVVYIGTGIFMFLLLFHVSELYLVPDNQETTTVKWTESNKKKMTQGCIENAKKSYANDPEGTTTICECTTEKIALKYTLEEFTKMNEEEMTPIIIPIINSCKDDIETE
ncbi:MAG: hypothetical protein HRT71_08565 [Flavobacteriales bacterium]|nr:hypothetical protein [Flavobacteriales bacterium]